MSDSEGYDQEYGQYSEEGQQLQPEDGFEEAAGEAGPCGKVQGGFCKCFMGIIGLPLSLYLLGWNEQQSVCKSNAFFYSQENVKNQYTGASCNSGAREGLAFLDCPITQYENFTLDRLNNRMQPTDFGNAIRIPAAAVSQTVEMYQCTEEQHSETRDKKKITTYRYHPTWSSVPIDFSQFQQTGSAIANRQRGCPGVQSNPVWPSNLAEGTVTHYANFLKAGQFRISETLIAGDSTDSTGFVPTEPVNLQIFANAFPKTATLANPSFAASLKKMEVTVQGNFLVTCSSQVQVGCVRVSFQKASPTKIAAVTQVGPGLETSPISIPSFWGCKPRDWQAAEGITGRSAQQKTTMDKFFEDLNSTNSSKTTLLRVLGLLMCWFSVYCCFGPLTAAADIFGDALACIPCCGESLEGIFEGMVECVLCLVSCTAGMACGMIVIGIVWVYMRPAWGIGLLVGAAVLICASFYFAKSNQKEKKGKKRMVDPEYAEDSQ